jgi:methionine aminopeptidase
MEAGMLLVRGRAISTLHLTQRVAGPRVFCALQVGHTFTIEPMINAGVYQDVMWPDGWTAVTADGSRSAQFEHGLVITEDGCEILTARTKISPPLWWEKEGIALDL